jgi:hypothetical protein
MRTTTRSHAAAKYSTRVVTTNYDLHLETALRAYHEGPLDVFRAPAMPLGDDFDGLVYLHGSAEDDPRRLVVTDRDFSSAHFHSAWAARFLERMFRKYVVLFVSDPVTLSQDEANALAVLAPQVPAADFDKAVALVEATSAGFNSHAEGAAYVSDGLIDSKCGGGSVLHPSDEQHRCLAWQVLGRPLPGPETEAAGGTAW